jgi:hypothetical protein
MTKTENLVITNVMYWRTFPAQVLDHGRMNSSHTLSWNTSCCCMEGDRLATQMYVDPKSPDLSPYSILLGQSS